MKQQNEVVSEDEEDCENINIWKERSGIIWFHFFAFPSYAQTREKNFPGAVRCMSLSIIPPGVR